MPSNRIVRVNELLKREIASDLVKLLDNTDINPATVMVSGVDTTPDLKFATVYVSVIGDAKFQEKALRVVERQRNELQRRINKVSSFKFTPRLTFILDHSIEKGDYVLDMIKKMEEEHPEWQDDESDY